MRKGKSKKGILIASLVSALVLMGIGYALLTQALEISGSNTVDGDWHVYIDSITPTTVNGNAVSRSVSKSSDGLSASFNVDLFDEGDYVEYTVVVRNSGNINALLNNVDSTIGNQSQFISMTNSLESPVSRIGEKLPINSTMTFTVRIAVNGNSDDLEDVSNSTYKITLRYLQDAK